MTFTEDLANQSLILVRPIVIDLLQKDFEMEGILNGGEISKAQEYTVKKLKRDLHYHMKELETIGCILRDREIGEVAFPINEYKLSRYFSWKFGEPAVSLVIREGETKVHIRPYAL